jgi:FkbM family methyltransferase
MDLTIRARTALSTLKGTISVGASRLVVRPSYRNPLIRFSHSGGYEHALDDILARCLSRKAGAFIDVGANIGQTFLKLVEIDNARQYIGFEPQLYGCFIIDDLIATNGYTNKTILPIGLSDRPEVVKLGVSRENDAAASFVAEYRPAGFYSGFRHIVTIPGDDALAGLGSPAVAVIKIDVEGAELEVIRGFRSTLATHKPFVLFEVLPHFLFKTKQELDENTKAIRNRRHAEIEKELRGMGYELFKITSSGLIAASVEAAPRAKYDYLAMPTGEARTF